MWAIRHGDLKLVHGDMNNDPPEFFDLAADIGEKNNLAASQPDKAKELKALWDQWNAQMAAPAAPKDKSGQKTKKKQQRQKQRQST
jgi:arylsulfatase A-like enzyme